MINIKQAYNLVRPRVDTLYPLHECRDEGRVWFFSFATMGSLAGRRAPGPNNAYAVDKITGDVKWLSAVAVFDLNPSGTKIPAEYLEDNCFDTRPIRSGIRYDAELALA